MQQRCPSKEQLLDYLYEVGFAVVDITLFLDTHPDCTEALNYYKEYVARKKKVMAEYTMRFGPLTIDSGNDVQSSKWEWINQPWPWEAKARRCN